MKNIFAFLLANLTAISVLADVQKPAKVPVMFKKVYVPYGFDNNDNVQIAAEGKFPNSCFKIAAPEIHIDEERKVITLDAKAYQYRGVCMQVQIPFQQVIDLGIIENAGLYSIKSSSGQHLGEVKVAQSRNSEPDDYFYAPVQRVSFEDEKENKVSLRIEFPMSCLRVEEVRVSKRNEVIVIKPIVKLDREFGCAMGYYPVTKIVDLGAAERGRFLLHVRSSGSQAHNQFIAIE